ncbi:MAG: hypothetical protein Q8O37_12855 [Sulfuricellaceae bacterium]|nr:hypothetical protein [Sulfuricellaceae bacterium]
MTPNSENSDQEFIRKLKQSDKVGDAGEILTVLAGVAGGAAAAGTLATAAGVTAVPFLTSAFGYFGIIFLTATPVGWIAGLGIAGGFIMLAIGKLIRSAGKQDQIRQDIIARLNKKLKARPAGSLVVFDPRLLKDAIDALLRQGMIEPDQAERIVGLVVAGKLDIHTAMIRLKAINSAV